MPSDITRLIFDQDKHYSGVRMQQGRVILDSDWNSQHDIYRYLNRIRSNDVIGLCGTPKHTNSYKISNSGNTFQIHQGRYYVNGLICELKDAVDYQNQPYYPNPEFMQPGLNAASLDLTDGTYIAFLKAWERERTYLDDSIIQEVALGEADTTSRLQTVSQVKLLKVESGITCKQDSAIWNSFIAPPTGKMNAKTVESAVNTDPCGLQQSGGYRRLENQLYRIEIQKGGPRNVATFKWSRDNASVETTISNINILEIKVDSVGKDDVLGFASGQWVEIVDENTSLKKSPYNLLKIDTVHAAELKIVLKVGSNPPAFKSGMKLRRWDQNNVNSPTSTSDGIPMVSGFMKIEEGLEIEFKNGNYRSGDYWLIPARTIIANIQWPGGAQLPFGIRYSYCKLAILTVTGNQIDQIIDCRSEFPSLTELNDLCLNRGKCCTYHVRPEIGWESVFDKIPDHGDAMICFEVGDFIIKEPKKVANKGNLKLVGSGFGTRIRCAGFEKTLIFDTCKSIIVKDLRVESGHVGLGKFSPNYQMGGSLTITDTARVHIDNLHIRNGHGNENASSCITVRSSETKYERIRPHVKILNCKLSVGYLQSAILLVNIADVFVENNTIDNYLRPMSKKAKIYILKNKLFRSEVRQWVSENISTIGRKAKDHIVKKINKYIFEDTMISDLSQPDKFEFRRFRRHLDHIFDRSFSSQGIIIGGLYSERVRVLNNNVNGMLEGFHLALSDSGHGKYKFGNIKIQGNNICIYLPVFLKSIERYGIFIGSCSDLIVDNNSVYLERQDGMTNANEILIDGIRVWGYFGRRIVINNNIIASKDDKDGDDFSVGIRVLNVNDNFKLKRWVISSNYVTATQSNYILDNKNNFEKIHNIG